jgi:predicted dehydrogenase
MRIQVEEDDITLLLLDFGDSVFAMLDTAWVNVRATLTPPLEIYGQKGVIAQVANSSRAPGQMDFDLRVYRDEPELGIRGWTQVEPIPPLKPEPSIAVAGLIHAIDCIIEDKVPIPSGEHARHCIEVIEKAFVAARTGITQEVETRF